MRNRETLNGKLRKSEVLKLVVYESELREWLQCRIYQISDTVNYYISMSATRGRTSGSEFSSTIEDAQEMS